MQAPVLTFAEVQTAVARAVESEGGPLSNEKSIEVAYALFTEKAIALNAAAAEQAEKEAKTAEIVARIRARVHPPFSGSGIPGASVEALRNSTADLVSAFETALVADMAVPTAARDVALASIGTAFTAYMGGAPVSGIVSSLAPLIALVHQMGQSPA